jgi:hypothetical protein
MLAELKRLALDLPFTFHRDPADRLIVASCLELDAPLLTHDRLIMRAGLVTGSFARTLSSFVQTASDSSAPTETRRGSDSIPMGPRPDAPTDEKRRSGGTDPIAIGHCSR